MPQLEDLLRSIIPGWTGFQDLQGVSELAKSAYRQGKIPKVRMQDGNLIAEDPTLDTPAANSGFVTMMQKDTPGEAGNLQHELRHSRQTNLLGPVGAGISLYEGLGGTEYGSGPLEHDAIRHSQPSAEPFIPKSKHPTVEAFIRGLLGD